jgi:anti-sigma regulatory factor (Ser/Thr protein kinase)
VTGTRLLRVSSTRDIADARRHAVTIAATVLDASRVRDVGLVVSELVSNAIEHGRGPADVSVQVVDDALEITVGSPADGDLELDDRPIAPGERRGRGLRIVNNLTDAMVVRSVDDQIEVAVRFEPS